MDNQTVAALLVVIYSFILLGALIFKHKALRW
jgi:hypothetical protein